MYPANVKLIVHPPIPTKGHNADQVSLEQTRASEKEVGTMLGCRVIKLKREKRSISCACGSCLTLPNLVSMIWWLDGNYATHENTCKEAQQVI
jgi:hypothetical protein